MGVSSIAPGSVNRSKLSGIAPYLSMTRLSPVPLHTVDASSVASPSAISGAGMNFEIFSKYFVTTNVRAAIAIA